MLFHSLDMDLSNSAVREASLRLSLRGHELGCDGKGT